MKNKITIKDGTGLCLEFDALSIAGTYEVEEDKSPGTFFFGLRAQGFNHIDLIGGFKSKEAAETELQRARDQYRAIMGRDAERP
jgi:hypothetical protein